MVVIIAKGIFFKLCLERECALGDIKIANIDAGLDFNKTVYLGAGDNCSRGKTAINGYEHGLSPFN